MLPQLVEGLLGQRCRHRGAAIDGELVLSVGSGDSAAGWSTAIEKPAVTPVASKALHAHAFDFTLSAWGLQVCQSTALSTTAYDGTALSFSCLAGTDSRSFATISMSFSPPAKEEMLPKQRIMILVRLQSDRLSQLRHAVQRGRPRPAVGVRVFFVQPGPGIFSC